ncbi:MAG TPA: prolyl oligopeptidase family serine peptidase, partial [Xanthomonadales bacterium]|nr:prolyl oligopeptidase family serine peptidase [Xanthomonadales bacterium]
NTAQVHRVAAPLAMREQLTFFDEPVAGVAPLPDAAGFVFGRDVGGSEFWQLYRFGVDDRSVARITDGKRSRNEAPVVSGDGSLLAFASTARNGTDSDIWLHDLRTGSARALVTEGGLWRPNDFSPDRSKLLVTKFVSINEAYPGEVDLATGKLEMFPVEGGKAGFRDFRFAKDGKSAYFVSDEGREFQTLWHHRIGDGAPVAISAKLSWDVDGLALSRDGRHLAYSSNEDGIGKLRLLALPGHEELPVPELPIGLIENFDFSPDGKRIALSLNTATSPSDVYVFDVGARELVRWTKSEVGGLDPDRFIAPTLVRYPTFDQVDGKPRTIPAFYYRPPGDGPFPVVVSIHGGPEAQAFPSFSPTTQFMLRELGIAVLVPNVRGSSGYGKQYLLLDNADKREDSVRDIGALLDWIAKQPELAADRVGVSGGSYGGYMVLASLIHYGDRLRAGYDVVGISDFATFLKNTESYRADARRAEYGDERDPKMAAYFEKISPLANAGKITDPLFVAQGANDPRVPRSEALQIVSKVRANGGDVWYLEFADEGHGFRKKNNADYATAASMLFWQKHLVGTAPGRAATR